MLEEDRSVVEIFDATFRMMVRPYLESETVLAIASTDNGKISFSQIEIDNTSPCNKASVSGKGIVVFLTPEDTTNMYTSETAIADIEGTFPDGTVIPEIVTIVFEPNLSVTRNF